MKPRIKKKTGIVTSPVFDRATISIYERRSKTVCLTIPVLFFVLASFACQPNPTILNSGRQTPGSSSDENSTERPKDTFETALRDVQKSGFDYILVIRRKDNEKIDVEDGRYIKTASPPETNQFVKTEEDRVVIIGSNYPFPPENLEVLRERFNVEDLSPKKDENTNGNSNTKTNTNSNT